MAVTIKDVAKKANVSIATVSRALNNKTSQINDNTRKKIIEIAKELNYRPNLIARSMKTKKTKIIGFIIPDIENPFFPKLARRVEQMLKEKGYNTILCNTDGDENKELEYFDLLMEKHVDGIIYTNISMNINKEILSIIKSQNPPIVLLDRHLLDLNINVNSVYLDNEFAGYIATKHLIKLGHKNIACITGPKGIVSSKERLNGYIRAHQESGLNVNKNYIVTGDYKIEGGYKGAKKILQNREITSIFAFNDLMALGVYEASLEKNIKIPNDLSVVGIDNL